MATIKTNVEPLPESILAIRRLNKDLLQLDFIARVPSDKILSHAAACNATGMFDTADFLVYNRYID